MPQEAGITQGVCEPNQGMRAVALSHIDTTLQYVT